MNDVIFTSGLASSLKNFLDFKRSFGIPYANGARYLKDFDRFCAAEYPLETFLTREACMSWAIIRPTENVSGFISRITPVRQFGKYLSDKGMDSFVLPEGLHPVKYTRIPHIFTSAELMLFFQATDGMEPYYQSIARHLVAPVMFRYLYCCGLRPYEARRLELSDINLETGRMFIKESKGHRERIVIMPEELIRVTTEYVEKIHGIFPKTSILFPNYKGNLYTYSEQEYLFNYCLRLAGISSSIKPTLYSFRHTFATYRMYLWMKDGYDIFAWLPYLSAFMGHSNYLSTAYYIHLIPEIFQDMVGMDMTQSESLLPEVSPD